MSTIISRILAEGSMCSVSHFKQETDLIHLCKVPYPTKATTPILPASRVTVFTVPISSMIPVNGILERLDSWLFDKHRTQITKPSHREVHKCYVIGPLLGQPERQ